MRAHLVFESLENRRLMSVSVASVFATSLVAGTPQNAVVRSERATFSVSGITASAGDRIRSVTYFIDNNSDGLFSKGDLLLGRSGNAASNFSAAGIIKGGLALGDLTISAVAQGSLSKSDFSAAVTQNVTVANDPPIIRKLTASVKKVFANKPFSLVASNVTDKDGSIAKVDFFLDVNGNGSIDAGDTLVGTDSDKAGGFKVDASSVIASAGVGQTVSFLARATDSDLGISNTVSVGVLVLDGPHVAPDSIAGRGIVATVSSGTGAFASSGKFLFLPHPDGTYEVFNSGSVVADNSGTYTYTRTGANTGTLTFIDSILGVSFSNSLVLKNARGGSYTITNFTLGGSQTGTFVLN